MPEEKKKIVIFDNIEELANQLKSYFVSKNTFNDFKGVFFNADKGKGDIYITTDPTNPSLKFGGTWELIGDGIHLENTTDVEKLGQLLGAELPNVSGSTGNLMTHIRESQQNGAIGYEYLGLAAGNSGSGQPFGKLNIDLSKGQVNADGTTYVAPEDSVYKNGGTVRPKSLLVFIWKRTDTPINLDAVRQRIEFNNNDFEVTENGDLTKVLNLKLGSYVNHTINRFYPLGSIIVYDNFETDPNTFLGTTWERIDSGYYFCTKNTNFVDGENQFLDPELPNVKGQLGSDYGLYLDDPTAATSTYISEGGLQGGTKTGTRRPARDVTDASYFHNSAVLDLSKGQVNSDGTTYVDEANSVYKDGGKVQPYTMQVFAWRRTSVDNDVYVDDFQELTFDHNFFTELGNGRISIKQDVFAKPMKQVATTAGVVEKNVIYLVGTEAPYQLYIKDENNNVVELGEASINPANYYTKDEVDEKLAEIDTSNYYTKTQTDAKFYSKTASDSKYRLITDSYTKTQIDTQFTNYYNKTEIDTALGLKANSADVYTKTETDTLLNDKADKSTTYTKTEVDTELAKKVDKTSIKTSISSSSADTEVPSAKCVYNKLKIETLTGNSALTNTGRSSNLVVTAISHQGTTTRVFKRNGVCTLNLFLQMRADTAFSSTWICLGSIPSGYRPSTRSALTFTTWSYNPPSAAGYVDTDGRIMLWCNSITSGQTNLQFICNATWML